MRVPFNNLKLSLLSQKEEFKIAFDETFNNTSFVLGEALVDFEFRFAEFTSASFVIGVANGSDALRIALTQANLERESSVLIAANTYFAGAAAIAHCGLKPVFFDVELDTRFPSQETIQKSYNSNVTGIIQSHLFGSADTVKLDYSIKIIHDCSQAHGTKYNNKQVGFGATSTFSFYPGKNLGAFGDAGAITTNSPEEYEAFIRLRNQGTSTDKYFHESLGFNSRMDSLQARILLIRLNTIGLENQLRQKVASRYKNNLSKISGIQLFKEHERVQSTYHLFQVLVPGIKNRVLLDALKNEEIDGGLHYPLPLHLQPAFSYLGYGYGDFPNSETLADNTISLPMFPGISDSQIDFVCESLIKIVGNYE
jgi:dTDP-4-amino-4,6-dideoxygalactose transaminase